MITELIKRNTPGLLDRFELITVASPNGKSFVRYESIDGRVCLTADCAVSMAVGYFAFLRDWCGGEFAADHSLRFRSFALPKESKTIEIPAAKRVCMEDTFFSCGACWWDWERWEKEIDYMAMNGVNMPLCAVGSEAVWFRTMLDAGMSEDYALTEISGPSYWGWQLSNCFFGCVPQVRRETVEARIALGRRIFEREKELGMTPILHAFSGYVSRLYIKAKLRARLVKADGWCKFSEQYMISTRDPAFMRIGSAYLKNQSLLIGESDYYLSDPFFAHEPGKKGDAYLAGVGTAILHAMTAHNENAVWVMRASSAKPAMLKSLDAERLLVLCDTPQEAPEGIPFVLANRFNGCGVTSLHGDMAALYGVRYHELAEQYPLLCGVGACDDGSVANECFSRYACSSLSEKSEPKDWMRRYFANRWQTDDDLNDIVNALLATCYRADQPVRETGSVICARPSLMPNHTAVGDAGCDVGYDNQTLFAAVEQMLSLQADGYEYELDVCDCLRQALSNRAAAFCKAALIGFKEKNVEQFESNSNAFLQLIEDLDRLLMTKKEFALPYHLQQAGKCGATDEESQNFEINQLAQITLFGPIRDNDLYDCCWKEWGGLLNTFYLMRWRAWFEYLAVSFKKRLPERTREQSLGRDAYLGSDFSRQLALKERSWISEYAPAYDDVAREDTLTVAKELLIKYQ